MGRAQIMAYELLARQRYFLDVPSAEAVRSILLGEVPLPHELASAEPRNAALGLLRECAAASATSDPGKLPTCATCPCVPRLLPAPSGRRSDDVLLPLLGAALRKQRKRGHEWEARTGPSCSCYSGSRGGVPPWKRSSALGAPSHSQSRTRKAAGVRRLEC